MDKANKDIRQAIKDSGLKCWQVADALEISDNTLFRRLRHEMDESDKEKMRQTIKRLSAMDPARAEAAGNFHVLS